MTILDIQHYPSNEATIKLTYKELLDLCNILNKHAFNSELHQNFFLIFELVKNGNIDGFTIAELHKIAKDIYDNKT